MEIHGKDTGLMLLQEGRKVEEKTGKQSMIVSKGTIRHCHVN